MHNDHNNTIITRGNVTDRERTGNKVPDVATLYLLADWCAEHRPGLVEDVECAVYYSRSYYAIWRYGRSRNASAMARGVRYAAAPAVVAFQAWSLSH